MRGTRLSLLVASLLGASALSGCTVYPLPLTDTELSAAADLNAGQVVTGQEPISGPVTLYEAMARALKYNLDHRVEEAEAAVRLAELDLAHFSMLPNVVANSGYAARDNYNASSSSTSKPATRISALPPVRKSAIGRVMSALAGTFSISACRT